MTPYQAFLSIPSQTQEDDARPSSVLSILVLLFTNLLYYIKLQC